MSGCPLYLSMKSELISLDSWYGFSLPLLLMCICFPPRSALSFPGLFVKFLQRLEPSFMIITRLPSHACIHFWFSRNLFSLPYNLLSFSSLLAIQFLMKCVPKFQIFITWKQDQLPGYANCVQ